MPENEQHGLTAGKNMSRYKTQYLMREAARGRQLPTDSPDNHLVSAIQQMNLWALREALEMGASPHYRNEHGEGVLTLLTNRAQMYGLPSSRVLPLLEIAWREGSRLGTQPHEVETLHQWLRQPDEAWLRFCAARPNLPWHARNRQGSTAADVIQEMHDSGRWPEGIPSYLPLKMDAPLRGPKP